MKQNEQENLWLSNQNFHTDKILLFLRYICVKRAVYAFFFLVGNISVYAISKKF